MRCNKCGIENPDDAQFCRHCGITMITAFKAIFSSNKRIVSGIIIGVFGGIFILFSLSASRDMSPSSDGNLLNAFYLLISFVFYPILNGIKRKCQIRSSNFCFFILLALFAINTLLLPMWNGSLVSSYLILSIGLGVNMLYVWLKE